MDLDTALQYVAEDTLGIRVSSLDEAKILASRTAELGLREYPGGFYKIPKRWSVYGLAGDRRYPTFWKEPSDFTRSHDIVDFCDLAPDTVDATDIQNLL